MGNLVDSYSKDRLPSLGRRATTWPSIFIRLPSTMAVRARRVWALPMLLPLLVFSAPAATWLRPPSLGRRAAAALATAVAEAAAAAPAAAAVSVEEGRQRLQDAQKSLEELLADYEQIKKSKSGST